MNEYKLEKLCDKNDKGAVPEGDHQQLEEALVILVLTLLLCEHLHIDVLLLKLLL